jgi:hypothetical protein
MLAIASDAPDFCRWFFADLPEDDPWARNEQDRGGVHGFLGWRFRQWASFAMEINVQRLCKFA